MNGPKQILRDSLSSAKLQSTSVYQLRRLLKGGEKNCIKYVEVKFSYTEQLDVLLELFVNLASRVCRPDSQPAGVNMRKHMNINEDADEKGATVLSELFWINEGLKQDLN